MADTFLLEKVRGAATEKARADAAVGLLCHFGLLALKSVSETDAAEAVVAALEACGNNENGGKLTSWISKTLESAPRVRRGLVAAGVIEALVRRLPCSGGGGSTSAARGLYCLCVHSDLSQEVRDTPGVLQALSGLEATKEKDTDEAVLWWHLLTITPTGRLTKAAREAETGKEEEEEEEE